MCKVSIIEPIESSFEILLTHNAHTQMHFCPIKYCLDWQHPRTWSFLWDVLRNLSDQAAVTAMSLYVPCQLLVLRGHVNTRQESVAFHVRKSLEVAITVLCLISPIINRNSTQPYDLQKTSFTCIIMTQHLYSCYNHHKWSCKEMLRWCPIKI